MQRAPRGRGRGPRTRRAPSGCPASRSCASRVPGSPTRATEHSPRATTTTCSPSSTTTRSSARAGASGLAAAWAQAPARVACIGGPVRPRFQGARPAWLTDSHAARAEHARLRPRAAGPRSAACARSTAPTSPSAAGRCGRSGASTRPSAIAPAVRWFSEEDEAQRALARAGYGIRYVARRLRVACGRAVPAPPRRALLAPAPALRRDAGRCGGRRSLPAALRQATLSAIGRAARGRARRRAAGHGAGDARGRERRGARRAAAARPMILVLHNRYRTTGGEERAVEDLTWLAREHMREEVEVLTRDSAVLGRARAAAAMLGGGLRPEDVGAAVRRTRAQHRPRPQRQPGLRLARACGGARGGRARGPAPAQLPAGVRGRHVLHPRGGLHPLPRAQHRARGRAALPRTGRRGGGLRRRARALAGPSGRAGRPLRRPEPLRPRPPRAARRAARRAGRRWCPTSSGKPPSRSRPADGRFALVASRLAPEKGVDTAIDACSQAGVPLVVCGDGPLREELAALAAAAPAARLLGSRQRGRAADASPRRRPCRGPLAGGRDLRPGRRRGDGRRAARGGDAAWARFRELLPAEALAPPGDATALAAAIGRRYGDSAAGEAGLSAVRERFAPAWWSPSACARSTTACREVRRWARAGVCTRTSRRRGTR